SGVVKRGAASDRRRDEPPLGSASNCHGAAPGSQARTVVQMYHWPVAPLLRKVDFPNATGSSRRHEGERRVDRSVKLRGGRQRPREVEMKKVALVGGFASIASIAALVTPSLAAAGTQSFT